MKFSHTLMHIITTVIDVIIIIITIIMTSSGSWKEGGGGFESGHSTGHTNQDDTGATKNGKLIRLLCGHRWNHGRVRRTAVL